MQSLLAAFAGAILHSPERVGLWGPRQESQWGRGRLVNCRSKNEDKVPFGFWPADGQFFA